MIGFVKLIDSINQVSFINVMNLSITLNIINVIYFTKVMKLVNPHERKTQVETQAYLNELMGECACLPFVTICLVFRYKHSFNFAT